MRTIAVTLLCLAVAAPSSAHKMKYRSKVYSIDRQTDFSTIKTYAWLDRHYTPDAELDERLIAAVDRELGALGMSKVAEGPADVAVTFSAYGRTDVKVNATEIAKRVRPTYGVGILVVSVLDVRTLRPLLELRAETPIERTARTAVVDQTVAEMFRLYPRRR